MGDRPLFGEGSARTAREKQRPKFLRANAPAGDGLVNRAALDAIKARLAPAQAQPETQQNLQQAVGQPVQQQTVANAAAAPQAPTHQPPGAGTVVQNQQHGAQQQVSNAAVTPETTPRGSVNDRVHKRARTLKGGIIVIPGQMMSSYGCKIRNESQGGALLQVAGAHRLPDEIFLVRDSDPGHRTPCKIAWRSSDKIGVMFINKLASE